MSSSNKIYSDEIITRFKNLYSGLINDSLRELNYMNQALSQNILPLKENMIVAGPAFTILSCKQTTKNFSSIDVKSKMEYRAEVLDNIYDNSVVVWDTNEDDICAHWGGMMTRTSKKKGCKGAIIDGGIRDTKEILKEDFPVFNRYRTSNGVLGRHQWLAYQVPININNVIIHPGDFVFGDIDGVVVIPQKIIKETLNIIEEKINKENFTGKLIDQGLTADEIAKKGGIF